jgi:hypothetical protein
MKLLANKKWLVVAVAAVTVGALLLLLAAVGRDQPAPPDTVREFVDKDTGETIRITPDISPEVAGSRELATVIGLTSLATFGSVSLAEGQIPVFRRDLATNGLAKLGEFDDIVKVVRPRLNPETKDFEAELIYMENKPPARLIFDIPDNTLFEYRILVDGREVYRSAKLFAGGQDGFYGE